MRNSLVYSLFSKEPDLISCRSSPILGCFKANFSKGISFNVDIVSSILKAIDKESTASLSVLRSWVSYYISGIVHNSNLENKTQYGLPFLSFRFLAFDHLSWLNVGGSPYKIFKLVNDSFSYPELPSITVLFSESVRIIPFWMSHTVPGANLSSEAGIKLRIS